MANKFGLVKLDCGINAWSNNCTEAGRIDLQNNLKGKAITEANIVKVFTTTKFMEIGGRGEGNYPTKVEIIQFFPEDGFVKLRAYHSISGTTINLKWDVPKVEGDYAELLKKYETLENRVALLEKLLAAK